MKNSIPKWVLGNHITPFQPTGNYDLVLGKTPANVAGPPPHLHSIFHEFFLILKGEMEFSMNGETRVFTSGQSINLPPNTVHTFRNNSDQPCEWLNVHSPKGFLKFFNMIGIDDSQENAEQESLKPEIIEKVIQLASDYDMEFQIIKP